MTRSIKYAFIVSLVIFLAAGAWADPAAASSENFPQEGGYAWISADDEQEPIGRLPLYPARPSFDIRTYYPDGEETIQFWTPESEGRAEMLEEHEYDPALQARYDAGYEIRTYRILGLDADISPAIIMVDERMNNEKFYFGFLSISIKF
jgi:hypothetical protein